MKFCHYAPEHDKSEIRCYLACHNEGLQQNPAVFQTPLSALNAPGLRPIDLPSNYHPVLIH